MLRKMMAILALSVVGSVHAANNIVPMSDFELWTTTYQDDVIRVIDLNGVKNPETCTNPDSYFVSTALSAKAQERIYSTLLAANFSEKSVRIALNGCQDNRPRLVSVLVK